MLDSSLKRGQKGSWSTKTHLKLNISFPSDQYQTFFNSVMRKIWEGVLNFGKVSLIRDNLSILAHSITPGNKYRFLLSQLN